MEHRDLFCLAILYFCNLREAESWNSRNKNEQTCTSLRYPYHSKPQKQRHLSSWKRAIDLPCPHSLTRRNFRDQEVGGPLVCPSPKSNTSKSSPISTLCKSFLLPNFKQNGQSFVQFCGCFYKVCLEKKNPTHLRPCEDVDQLFLTNIQQVLRT